MIYPTFAELVYIAERAVDGEIAIRDAGMLHAAATRPQAAAFGVDAYPGLEGKAAALLHSLARNRALVDGNKRLALAGTIAFLGVNGRRLTLTNDEAYELVIAVAAGDLDDLAEIATILGQGAEPWCAGES